MIEANPEYIAGYIPTVTCGVYLIQGINPEGDEAPLRFARQGEHLIECFFDAPVNVYAISPEHRLRYIDATGPVVRQGFLDQQEQTLRRMEHLYGTVPDRLIKLLGLLCDLTEGGERTLMLGQQDIAALICTTYKMTGRYIGLFAREGLLSTGYRQINLLDPPGIRALKAQTLTET